MKLCIELYEYQVQQGIDTTFIDNEYNLVWDSIHEAFDNELITKEEFQILWEYKQLMKKYHSTEVEWEVKEQEHNQTN